MAVSSRRERAGGGAAPGARRFSYEQLDLLAGIAHDLGVAEDIPRALRRVLDQVEQVCGMRRGVITLLQSTDDELQAAITVSSISENSSHKMRYRPGEGITGTVFATGRALIVPDLARDPRFLNRSGLRQGLRERPMTFFCVPMVYREAVVGTLSCDKRGDAIADPELELAFLEEVASLLAPFVQRRRLEEQMDQFSHAVEPGGAFESLIGRSAPMEELKRLLVKVAQAPSTVLLTGETGTGKGVAARAVHALSPRAARPFVEVNAGAIPAALLESELFGHEKGAFTGALQRRVGVLERAGEGTVFLDEIGELPLEAQTRLLRVLQTRQFERVGGSETLSFRARIVAATNRDLDGAVNDGRFRPDLFYRLNVFPIRLPALRERGKADIMLLADHFVGHFARQMKKTIHRLDTPAIDMLTAYHWPGNVRELENVIERGVLLAEGTTIHGHHLPPSLQMSRYAPQPETAGSFHTLVRSYEVELITDALKDARGNQTQAAARLGLTKRIIQYKIRQYGIDYRSFR
ncbi:MAG: Nitrogen fixation protein VnfA [Lentisphaerae bacterium ADurb.BinA184]|nr:MAG: Nitrogen fixation protein VnfA [Lentisphaerae bacterium ADurb.BinA184]